MSRHTRQHERRAQRRTPGPLEALFTCVHCHLHVSCAPALAGVQNRNHCPACLWSRHLDWREPGDRMSSCRAPMEPVGLTTRRGRNKYAAVREADAQHLRDGELMLIHRCTGCGKLVLNRIAADDSADEILAVFARSLALGDLWADLATQGVHALAAHEAGLLRRRLFGGGA